MTLELSTRASRILQAEIRAMSIECERLGGINLAQGVCDTEAPKEIRRAAADAIERGVNSYTRYDGLARLRRAIAGKLEAFNGIVADPETQITVSAGSTGAFYAACLALLDHGDEVVVFEPYYGYHVNTLLAVDAVPKVVPLRPPDWQIVEDELDAAVNDRTKAIVVNTPANPSGKVFTESELKTIAAAADRHDLFVFTDEIYEHFVYDGARHVSPGSLPGMAERTVTISGFSKVFSITGWRIGYSVCDPQWAEAIGYCNDLVYVCAPAPLQAAVAVGIEELAPEFYEVLGNEYAAKRDKLCAALVRAGLDPLVPAGAYYVLADVSGLPGANSKEKAMFLLHETAVATVPGGAFFDAERGEALVRLCFAKPSDQLEEACRRLQRL